MTQANGMCCNIYLVPCYIGNIPAESVVIDCVPVSGLSIGGSGSWVHPRVPLYLLVHDRVVHSIQGYLVASSTSASVECGPHVPSKILPGKCVNDWVDGAGNEYQSSGSK